MLREHLWINAGGLLMEHQDQWHAPFEIKGLCTVDIKEHIVWNSRYQSVDYYECSDYIKSHRQALKNNAFYFQSVQAPNGLIAHMFGPIEGRRHDAFMLGVSGLSDKLQRFWKPNGEPYVIYGDLAYGLARNILAPFRGTQLTNDEQEFNREMSKVRTSVEWGFGKICQNFAFLDFKKNFNLLESITWLHLFWQIATLACMGLLLALTLT